MKTRLTFLFIFLATLAHAQYDYYYEDEPMFGVGLGFNVTSIVGDDVRPSEVSMRYRINNDNMLQLYIPVFRQNNSFQSQAEPNIELIETSLDTKKQLYGIGLGYDYTLQRFASLDFVIGLRAEYQLYKYKSNLSNSYTKTNANLGGAFNVTNMTHRDKQTRNYIISPNAGVRLKMNRFAIDAKFLLSMLSIRGDVYNRIETNTPSESSKFPHTEEWTDHISNKLKLKPGVILSTSYFF